MFHATNIKRKCVRKLRNECLIFKYRIESTSLKEETINFSRSQDHRESNGPPQDQAVRKRFKEVVFLSSQLILVVFLEYI